MGDGQAFLSALIVPSSPLISHDQLEAAIQRVNQDLPDYARLGAWLIGEALTTANGLATANGRPKRAEILKQYEEQLNAIYSGAVIQ
jgi:hypothetical protein